MNSTLELYRTSVMKPEQNWCFDDMAKFLAAYTTEYLKITDYQFLRPELTMSIKIDRTQNDSLLSNARWDYLKVTINTSIYYFFITHIIQVSQKTLRLELKMDVLNTFKFTNTAWLLGGNRYYLSKKSLITREHKNRFQVTDEQYFNQQLTDETRQQRTDFFNGDWDEADESTPIFAINKAEIRDYVRREGWIGLGLLDLDDVLNNTIDVIFPDGTIKSCVYLYFTSSTIDLDDWDGNIIESISWSNVPSWIGIRGNFPVNFQFNKREEYTDKYDEYFLDGIYPRSNRYTMRKYIYSYRIVDKYQEGLDVVLFKNPQEEILLDEDGFNNWTMFYIANNAVVQNPSDTAALYVNPVKLNFVKDNNIQVNTSSARRVTISPQYKYIKDYSNVREYLCIYVGAGFTPVMSASAYIELPDGTRITKASIEARTDGSVGICFSRINNDDNAFDSCFYIRSAGGDPQRGVEIASNVAYFIAYDIDEMKEDAGLSFNLSAKMNMVYIGSAATTDSGAISSWDNLDLTNAKLIKALALPYSPIDWIVGQSTITIPDNYSLNADFNSLEISATQKADLSRQIDFGDKNPLKPLNKLIGFTNPKYNDPRNIDYESKLYHSDFYLPKFVYDSFAFPFYLEDVDIEAYKSIYNFGNFIVTYAVSKNMLSKMMFRFEQYLCNRERQDYNNTLIIDRNNERALYTSAYINYIRSGGYSYDTKKANSQNALNGLLTAFSIAASIASFASTPVTGAAGIAAGIGLATGATSSVIRTIHTAQEQDRAVHQKINQMQLQSMSVSSEEDIDLFTMMSGNKAKLVLYEPSAIMKNALWDLFYYCGYATHEQKIPDVTTRCNFNFVQGEVIIQDYNFSDDFADEIKLRWKEGITFFHVMPNNFYDIKFEYENFETFLLEE